MDSLIDNDSDEILDQLYLRIHQFLYSKVGEDLDQDLIDISLESAKFLSFLPFLVTPYVSEKGPFCERRTTLSNFGKCKVH